MTIFLKEIIDIHEAALNLTNTEASLLYNIAYDITYTQHEFYKGTTDILINYDDFFYYYPSIMFRFMALLLDLKSI